MWKVFHIRRIHENLKNCLYEYINNWWKKKAIRRYTKLLEQDRIKDETLFYNDMFNMTWEEAREKYLTDVGR